MSELEDIGIDPKYWGNHFWNSIEAIACTLNYKNRNHIYKFLDHLKFVLPCPTCRNHYTEFMNRNNVKKYIENPLTLFIWIHRLKNEILKRQEREEVPFKKYVDQVMDKFDFPELQYYLDRNEEMKRDFEELGIKDIQKNYRYVKNCIGEYNY